jgi:H+/Cl- antiporter ClcA
MIEYVLLSIALGIALGLFAMFLVYLLSAFMDYLNKRK